MIDAVLSGTTRRTMRLVLAAWLACSAVLVSSAAEQDALDEIVDESELERNRQSSRRNPNSDADFVTITRNGSRTDNGSIKLQVRPYAPQREIRFRASSARHLAEGANFRLELQRDRLTSRGAPIRSVTLEFTAGTVEADGVPVLIPFGARTSLFNFDYVRLLGSTQPLIATLNNAMDPETLRCANELRLGIGAEDFHDRFVLVGNQFGDCNRSVKSRVGHFIFADAIAQHLRDELRDVDNSLHKQSPGKPGRESGIVFVVWLQESAGNDVRLVRSLNGTSLLLFNGPAWSHALTVQQRDALRIELEKAPHRAR